jgi:hypothetical protein
VVPNIGRGGFRDLGESQHGWRAADVAGGVFKATGPRVLFATSITQTHHNLSSGITVRAAI